MVADATRTSKTICLAVSPSLKAYGLPGRPRLFEVESAVHRINLERQMVSPNGMFSGRSTSAAALQADPGLALDYIVAPPRMAYYMDYSARIYNIYLRHFSSADVLPYSVDEVFIDATKYLDTYSISAHELTIRVIRDILKETGITATAGIGTNIYLAKVAMDIVAKHLPADADGVRIAELDERRYRELLWSHRPLTDFWRFGRGTVRKLESYGLMTMGDIARRSITNENLFYKLFGVMAEYVIDHAWGYEPVTIKDAKSHQPQSNSISTSQVLAEPYDSKKARTVVLEMAQNAALSLVERKATTQQLTLSINYEVYHDTDEVDPATLAVDYYGRHVHQPAHGTATLKAPTASARLIGNAVTALYDSIIDPSLSVRRITIAATLLPASAAKKGKPQQLDLFTDVEAQLTEQKNREENEEREQRLQEVTLAIKRKYGKNALLHGTNFEPGATAMERNRQIGGHKA